VLEPISAEMDVIENGTYHKLLLMARGELDPASLAVQDISTVDGVTLLYGVANWYLYNGQSAKAEDLFRQIVAGPQWAAFGYIVAEAELARRHRQHTWVRMRLVNFEEAKRLLRAFEEEGVRYALFGGAALNFHGIARFTDDIDVFIEPEEENIARLREALMSVYEDPEIAQITASDLLGDYPAVQYTPPGGSFHLDILTRLGDAFRFSDLEIIRLPFEGIEISVVSPRTLYRMKRDTVRLRDRADAALLRERFSLEDD
jgi:hypothetical protein